MSTTKQTSKRDAALAHLAPHVLARRRPGRAAAAAAERLQRGASRRRRCLGRRDAPAGAACACRAERDERALAAARARRARRGRGGARRRTAARRRPRARRPRARARAALARRRARRRRRFFFGRVLLEHLVDDAAEQPVVEARLRVERVDRRRDGRARARRRRARPRDRPSAGRRAPRRAFAHWSIVTSARWLRDAGARRRPGRSPRRARPAPRRSSDAPAPRRGAKRAQSSSAAHAAANAVGSAREGLAPPEHLGALVRPPASASTTTRKPIRSASCGRRSPSSGFIVPTSRKRDGCADRHALALDGVDAQRGGVEQDVREVVVEQVDLVDVEDSAVHLGEQARLERGDALAQRAGDVDRAGDAVVGRVERQRRRSAPGGARPAAPPRAPGGRGRPRRRTPGRTRTGSRPTTSSSGSSAASPRTAVDFAVPLGPSTSTPPIAGLTALSRSACFRRSCPTIAVKGYGRFS